MNITYKEIKTDLGDVIIERDNQDGTITSIPSDPANSDYQAYLKSLEEGTIS